VGATSDCELADVYLSERVAPGQLLAALRPALPAGLEALSAEEVGLAAPALQTQVRWAEYEVDVPGGERPAADVRGAISNLLGARSLPWERQRADKLQRYDLRPLVVGLWLEAEGEGVHRLAMRLRVSQKRGGRADQVWRRWGWRRLCGSTAGGCTWRRRPRLSRPTVAGASGKTDAACCSCDCSCPPRRTSPTGLAALGRNDALERSGRSADGAAGRSA
jgi:hypothetical protein